METSFISGVFVGSIIGFLIATLCYIASEIRDDEEIEMEKEGKNENNRW